MDKVVATVVLPTTGDRGPLLRHSVGSVLAQTVQHLEVLIIGDGIDADTRAAAADLCERDRRVRLFEFPKHERRGERHRHEILLTEARGRFVAYICDRDLWLPGHLAEIGELLAETDFAHTLRFRVGARDEYVFLHDVDLRDSGMRARVVAKAATRLVPLSIAAHTLDAYRRLPHGWRVTPSGFPTDTYMWLQFLGEHWVRVGCSPLPTVLSFKRGEHPGWSTQRRLEILEEWAPRVATPSSAGAVQRDVLDALWRDWSARRIVEERRPARRTYRSLVRRLRRLRIR